MDTYRYNANKLMLWLALSTCAVSAFGEPVAPSSDSTAAISARINASILSNLERSNDLQPSSAANRSDVVKIRTAIDRIHGDLSSFAFRERVERFRRNTDRDPGQKIDVITAAVSVEGGQEKYSEIYKDKKRKKTIECLSGAWSAGGYRALLLDVKKALNSDPVPVARPAELNGAQAVLLPFDVFDGRQGSWEFVVRSVHYLLPFHGEVWASATTGDILKVSCTSLIAPSNTGIREVHFAVEFGSVKLNGKPYTVPIRAYYCVSYLNNNHQEFNLISFSEFHRYEAEMLITFPEYGPAK